ncbi:MAG TPA: bifunctional diaminohydroxyphosphoribosylaminopyrimidine deaminase/5-amino-6-(5-phosphoribosylamino)uracil reductase RibD [Candidatus Dormibacteraeota bacterium]|nr:bifunctional diaminohydroxyphosphoribosylaminopyrimidine deaminase/5-amino-6-(5-phosphoribosylamino)uracil reductase RibD [Candidatus Dormibacteraeota bacterium]
MSSDADFMRQAIVLARRGLGRTSPNPPVGAVVVARGRIVGRGWHRRPGVAHGEAAALRAAGARARGSTLYVTLEPCNHHGRTPPCTEAILAAGVRRVVFGARDPNPHVRGGGAARLRRAGIEVVGGVERVACEEVIAGFTSLVRRGRPLLTLKLAATLDGRIATRAGDSRWISGPAARRLVHQWRDEMDAVMVGIGTVLADDPRLTCRRRGGRDPLRVIVDSRLRIPLSALVLTKEAAPATLLASVISRGRKHAALRGRGATVLSLPGRGGRVSLRRLLAALGGRGVASVLLEGGATLAAAALREGLVDRLALFVAPRLIGGDGRPMLASLGVRRLSDAPRLRLLGAERVGDDWLLHAVPEARRAG